MLCIISQVCRCQTKLGRGQILEGVSFEETCTYYLFHSCVPWISCLSACYQQAVWMFYIVRFSPILREGHASRQYRIHSLGLGKPPLILIYSENHSLYVWPLTKPALRNFFLFWNPPIPSVNTFKFVQGYLLGILF